MFQKSVLTKKIVVLSKLFCFRIEKNKFSFNICSTLTGITRNATDLNEFAFI